MRRVALPLLVLSLLAPLHADDAGPKRYVLPDGPENVFGGTIERADARTGIIELEVTDPRGREPDEVSVTEGYYLAVGMAGPRTLVGGIVFAARVTEVLPEGRFRAQVAPEAVDRFEAVNLVAFCRPPGSTTAEMKDVPKVAGIVDKSSEIAGIALAQLARLEASRNNLKQIAIALHNYHDTHRRFPPRVLLGPDGKPWHSWRVMILPFLEKADLHDRYRWDEPWNGPNNKKLIAAMPSVFHDPVHGKPSEKGITHYATAAGTNTALSDVKFDGTQAGIDRVRNQASWFASITDGTTNTLLVGSVSPEAAIPWTKPEDIAFDDEFPGIGEKGGFAAPFEGKAGKAAVFAFCDGSVRTVRADIGPALLRNLLVRNDGRAIGEIPSLDPPRRRGSGIPVLEIHETDDGLEAQLKFEPRSRRGSGSSRASDGSAPPRERPDTAEETSEGDAGAADE